MIKIQNISKYYNEHKVLDDISLAISPGEVIVVCGPSGSGKSTLLRCINNLEVPTDGEILIDNIKSSDRKIYEKIGMVFQNFNLFPHMNVLGNLCYAPIKVKGLDKNQVEKRAFELLAKIGLSDKAHAMSANLSGGQKQRVAIARTLMMQPEIILFDEPTSALDPEMVKEVLELIKSLASTGITIMIVTHEMSFANNIATRILFLDKGKVLEDATPHEFFTSPQHERTKQFLDNMVF